MIKELRIGNSILQFGKVISVSTYTLQVLEENGDAHDYAPILLTDEVLAKCGLLFSKTQWPNGTDYAHIWAKDSFSIIRNPPSAKWDLYLCRDYDGITVTCLHQLQNLYFTLTGEELNIEL
jgi:hypothetical protein